MGIHKAAQENAFWEACEQYTDYIGNRALQRDMVCAGEDVGHYGGSYKVTYDLYKKFGDMRLLDTPICGAHPLSKLFSAIMSSYSYHWLR